MPKRWVVLFLACVLLWSGFGAIEPLHDAAAASAVDAGSVQNHHLDDQPSQLQSEPGAQTPGLLPASPEQLPVGLRMARPHPFRLDALRAPVLAGPLRPPCGTRPAA